MQRMCPAAWSMLGLGWGAECVLQLAILEHYHHLQQLITRLLDRLKSLQQLVVVGW